eukprot:4421436-Amphidinium_carterae.4
MAKRRPLTRVTACSRVESNFNQRERTSKLIATGVIEPEFASRELPERCEVRGLGVASITMQPQTTVLLNGYSCVVGDVRLLGKSLVAVGHGVDADPPGYLETEEQSARPGSPIIVPDVSARPRGWQCDGLQRPDEPQPSLLVLISIAWRYINEVSRPQTYVSWRTAWDQPQALALTQAGVGWHRPKSMFWPKLVALSGVFMAKEVQYCLRM